MPHVHAVRSSGWSLLRARTACLLWQVTLTGADQIAQLGMTERGYVFHTKIADNTMARARGSHRLGTHAPQGRCTPLTATCAPRVPQALVLLAVCFRLAALLILYTRYFLARISARKTSAKAMQLGEAALQAAPAAAPPATVEMA